MPQVLIKHEYENPGGSHYDRAYLETITHLELAGMIRPGDELRDMTSGSAGSSLAFLGQQLGYQVRVLVPTEIPEARVAPMRAYGAEVVRTGLGYIEQASRYQRQAIIAFIKHPEWRRLGLPDVRTRAIVFEHNGSGQRICFVNHSENQLTVDAFGTIADEIIRDTSEPPAAVALAIGNGTTIAGMGPVFRAAWPDTALIGYTGTTDNVSIENFGTMTGHVDIPLRFYPTALALLDEQAVVSQADRDAMHERVNSDQPLNRQLGRSSLMGLVVAERQTSPHQAAIAIGYNTMNRY